MIDNCLSALLERLNERGYSFVTPTPVTHARVLARPDRRQAQCLEDVLGWSLPFRAGSIDPRIEQLLDDAQVIERKDGSMRSLVRVSSLQQRLFLHSAFPTDAPDAVFFGPDSYRFADLVTAEIAGCGLEAGQLIVDVGTGAGVGAIVAARLCPEAAVAMTDINPAALRLARINAEAVGVDAMALHTEQLDGIEGSIDVALANPPYLLDAGERKYRHGGGALGGQVTLDMAGFILPRLAPAGRLILYSGSAIVRGEDRMRQALAALADVNDCRLRYREIDPDVFGEELDSPAYAEVDRIAVIAAVFEQR